MFIWPKNLRADIPLINQTTKEQNDCFIRL
jgi:hypothetical protein